MRLPFPDSPEFQRLLAGEGVVDLARIALEIARDAYPDLEVEPYLARIEELANRVRLRCRVGSKAREILGQINWVLYVEEEFRGNSEDYYDVRNSYLNEVMDRRLGIPISLSVLYQAVAELLGLTMQGVNLPGHFMLRVDEAEQTWFVDPYDGGTVMNREACERKLSDILQQPVTLSEAMSAPCPVPVVVSRILRNVKAIYLNANDIPSALPVQRRLTALNPTDSREVQDLGILSLKADRPGEAIDPIQIYLASSPDAAESKEILAIFDVARRRVAQSN